MEYTENHKVIGTEPCGCKVIQHPDTKGISPFVHYCPLHKSAPDLYEACKEFIDYVEGDKGIEPSDADYHINVFKLALAKVEGK